MARFGVVAPEARVLERLTRRLRVGAGAETWARAGEALAQAVLASRGSGGMDRSASDLADTMVGSLVRVQAETLETCEPGLRLRLALAAVALSVSRPGRAAACDVATGTWLSWDLGPERWIEDERLAAGRVLLFLFLGDDEAACDAVADLGDRFPDGLGLVLRDWVVARVQRHGVERETGCFHHFRLLGSLASAPLLLVAGAAALARHAGRSRREVLGWLDDVALDRPEVPPSARSQVARRP